MKQKIEVDKLIFDFVYELALRDAVMRTAYLGDKSELRKNEDAKNIVRDYANETVNSKSFDYNKFYKIAEELCRKFNPEINDELKFTFGNAQKLLNMTMKYLYIMCYDNKKLRENFRHYHCPMDGIMIDKVKKEFKNCSRKEKEEHIGKFKYKSWSRLTFTNKDKEAYNQFQESVKFLAKKQNLSPLEYDYYLWNKKEETTAD